MIRIADVVSAVSSLADVASVVFSTATAERMMPIHETFAQAEAWGSPRVLRQYLDAVWSELEGYLTDIDCERAAKACYRMIPTSQDFASPISGLAACAPEATAYALEGLGRSGVNYAMDSLESVRDGWFYYIRATTERGLAADPENHPLMQEQMRRDLRLVERLAGSDLRSRSAIASIQRESAEQGRTLAWIVGDGTAAN